MLELLGTFPIVYSEDEDVDIYEGLMNDLKPETVDFYLEVFGIEVIPGESTPLGGEEWFDERVEASALGLAKKWKPADGQRVPAGAFLVESLDEAKKILAERKMPVIEEISVPPLRTLVVADPDGNLIAIFEDPS